MSQGNFACGEFTEIQVLAESIWADNRANEDYIPQAEAAQRVIEYQGVKFDQLEVPDKDREVSVKWLNACAIEVDDCGDECTIEGPELEGACQTYALTQCKETSFSVKEFESRTSIFETKEKIAKGMLTAKKVLDEYISKRTILELDSFAGVNNHTGGIGTVSGTDTTISASNWTMGMMSYFALVKAKNKFPSAWMLHGENLFQAAIDANWNSGNADGKGNALRANYMPMYWDVFNMDTMLSPDKKSFMIQKGSVAISSKAYYANFGPTNPRDFRHYGQRWSENSMTLPGVKYDVFYNISCAGNEITHNFKLKTKFDVFLNPTGCTTTNTGVLTFSCA